MSTTTPLMRQYHSLKAEVKDALLLFQVGDFFELFFDDAVDAAQILHIALTARGKNNGEPIPLCGVPLHAVDHYIAKLLATGRRVAIAQQVEPAQAGVVVKREITRVLTPGTLIDDQLLDAQTANYILAAHIHQDMVQLIFAELLSSHMLATQFPCSRLGHIDYELARFYPREIITAEKAIAAPLIKAVRVSGYTATPIAPERIVQFQQDGLQWQKSVQLRTSTAASLDTISELSNPLSLLYAHLRATHVGSLEQLSSLHVYAPDEFLFLDTATQRNLELVKNSADASRRNTLVSVLDNALTGMGSRMVQKWIVRPLRAKNTIEKRLSAVEQLFKNVELHQQLRPLLQQIGDLERVTGRIGLSRATVRDLHQLRRALQAIEPLRELIGRITDAQCLLRGLVFHMPNVIAVYDLLCAALMPHESKEHIIADGYDKELDRLREIKRSSHSMLAQLECQEREKTGIPSLKIAFNRVQGYYIEVTKTHVSKVPERYKGLQKLVGKSRYSTPELAQLQQDIARADKEIEQVESCIFEKVLRQVYQACPGLRKVARSVATIDALWSLACAAYNNGYVRPILTNQVGVSIVQGRHPIVERACDGAFVPNDAQLDADQRTMIITGPNMGGKSTYLRQVALIAHMAHVGSFVPAASAEIGLLDRIFTRIGAGDNLASGKSTFLVEMEETSHICNYATNRSLVILDEVGRGTSTQDGIAIAQAVVTYLHDSIACLTLFATHYHELALLTKQYTGIINRHASCSSTGSGLVFHHTIKPGALTSSFGIDVARLAGLPAAVIAVAQDLSQSEVGKSIQSTSLLGKKDFAAARQDKELEQLRAVVSRLTVEDVDDISPRKALQLLWDAQKMLRDMQALQSCLKNQMCNND